MFLHVSFGFFWGVLGVYYINLNKHVAFQSLGLENWLALLAATFFWEASQVPVNPPGSRHVLDTKVMKMVHAAQT